ncbi:protein FAM135A-like [Xenopus laevis]|uniref:Protein FAM135A-like n=1 Tax=Xenopus laevis TaxID=8355 RepID=A0A8J1LVC3_XENLA|nr:protein FAM135A-like [Xenopus laevis]
MEKVQATLEFSLQLKQFQIPFFLQSGCYQIKTSFEILTSIPHTIEARIFHTEDNVKYPASVEGSVLFSSAFKLKKTKRAIRIDDVVIYTVNILLDESQVSDKKSFRSALCLCVPYTVSYVSSILSTMAD